MTDNKLKRFLIPIAITVLIFSIFKTINNDENEQSLKAEKVYVIGEITNHKIIGIAETYYIYYEYLVGNIKYSKYVINSLKYSDCERTRNCIGNKHPVYYDVDNPNNSFIDLYTTESELKEHSISKHNLSKFVR